MGRTATPVALIATFLIICCCCTTPSTAASTRKTLTTATKFDDYLKLLQRTEGEYAEQLRIVESVWKEWKADYPKDLKKLATLYKQLPDFLEENSAKAADSNSGEDAIVKPIASPNKLKMQKQAARELQSAIRAYLVKRHADLLGNVFNGEMEKAAETAANYCLKLLAEFETQMVQDIFFMAIDDIYDLSRPDKLAMELLQIYQRDDRTTFEFMIEMQLYLHWKFTHNGDISDEYLNNFAYYIYQFQNEEVYKLIDNNLKRRIDRALDSVPSSLRSFLFEREFCLFNKFYNLPMTLNEYTNFDTYRKGVFVTKVKTTNGSLLWTREVSQNSSDLFWDFRKQTNPTYMLRANLTKINIYMDPDYVYLPKGDNQTDLILGWSPGTVPPTHSQWTLELNNNNLIFKQDAYTMCANTMAWDANRFYVNGLSWNATIDVRRCQWYIEKC